MGTRAHHLRGLPAARFAHGCGTRGKTTYHRQLPGVFLILLFRCENSICGAPAIEAARALEESNALLNSVFEGTGDALYVKDLEGRYVIVNKTYADFLQLPVRDVIGKTTPQLIDSETAKRIAAQDREVIEAGTGKRFEYDVVLDGQTHHLLTTKAPQRDATGKIVGVIGVLRDITEYRHMEDRLRQSQKMEAIGTLAGGVAHDFNNLLTVINGYGSILSDALPDDTKLRGHVDQIQKAAERAMALTRQLLAFSRKQTIQPGQLKLNHVIAGMEKLLRRLIGEDHRDQNGTRAGTGLRPRRRRPNGAGYSEPRRQRARRDAPRRAAYVRNTKSGTG